MEADGMEALKDDLTRLERQVAEVKAEMLHDQEEISRLKRRLDEGEARVNRLRGHLDRLWALRVTQHEKVAPGVHGGVTAIHQPRSPSDPTADVPSSDVAEVTPTDVIPPTPVELQGRTGPAAVGPPSTDDELASSAAPRTYIPPTEGAAGELAAFLATLDPRRKDFSGMRRRSDGTAPDGFAHAVRQVAHRSIARAGTPLDRNAIFLELEASGVKFPDVNAKLKVSKILTRDPDLENLRGSGYFLKLRGLRRQLSEIRSEMEVARKEILPGQFWGRWDKDDGKFSP